MICKDIAGPLLRIVTGRHLSLRLLTVIDLRASFQVLLPFTEIPLYLLLQLIGSNLLSAGLAYRHHQLRAQLHKLVTLTIPFSCECIDYVLEEEPCDNGTLAGIGLRNWQQGRFAFQSNGGKLLFAPGALARSKADIPFRSKLYYDPP